MAYFERHVQKTRKFNVKYLFLLIPVVFALLFWMSSSQKSVGVVAVEKTKITKKIGLVADDSNKSAPVSSVSLEQKSRIDQLADSKELRDSVKVEKVWNDGTLSFKVGEDIVTVTSDGAVLYLPKEL